MYLHQPPRASQTIIIMVYNTPNIQLVFIHLIGTAYDKKYATGFANVSPTAHFLKFRKPKSNKQHSEWLEDIQQNTWLHPQMTLAKNMLTCGNKPTKFYDSGTTS